MINNRMEDLQLLQRVQKGDCEAFKTIYDKYAKDLLLYAVNVIDRKTVCEDMIQEIFISLWSRRKTAKITSLKPYLFQAVKYRIFNYYRDNKFSSEDLTRLNIIDVSMSISQKLEYSELDQRIRRSVAKLPKRCRQVFILSRYQHKSNKEIAEELQISVQAVKNQITKALAVLRSNLQLEEAIFVSLILLF